MKQWFITGISRGFGLAVAKAALAAGDRVVGTVRSGRPDIEDKDGRLDLLTLDMTDKASIDAQVAEAFRLAGKIDVIVNNAGYGLLGAIEKATDEELNNLFQVDVFGPFRVIRAALPFLKHQASGHIINVTSIAGRAPAAGAGLYAAAKYALEGLSVVLAQEVRPFGVKVTAVAPGAFRTDFLSPHSLRWSAPEDAAYDASVGKGRAAWQAMAGRQAGDPERAAGAILALAASENPPLHLLLGSDAWTRARAKLDLMTAEMDAWREVTLSTDYPKDA